MEKTYEYQKVRMEAIKNETIKLKITKVVKPKTSISQLNSIKV